MGSPQQKVARNTPPRPPAPTLSLPPPAEGEPQVTISAEVPAPPPPLPRGFTTRKSGQVLSPHDLVRQRAAEAFDELDREAEKHKGQ